jgi:PAS domain S-box-containing protein
VSHRPTCSWDGSHQKGHGKVELAFLRPLLLLYGAREGSAALAEAMAPANLRPDEARFDDVWLQAAHAEAILQAIAGSAGPSGMAGLYGALDAAEAGFSLTPGWDGRSSALELLGHLEHLLPGARLQGQQEGFFGSRCSLRYAFKPSALFQAYCLALVKALLRHCGARLRSARTGPTADAQGLELDIYAPGLGRLQAGALLAAGAVALGSGAMLLQQRHGPMAALALLLGGALLPLALRSARLTRLRRRLEQQVQQQQRQLRFQNRHLGAMQRIQQLLADGPQEGLAIFDAQGALLFANKRLVEIHGSGPAGAPAGGLAAALQPLLEQARALGPGGRAIVDLPQGGGKAGLRVEAVAAADEGASSLLLRYQPLADEDQRRAEAAARAELLAALIEHGQEAVLIVESGGGIRYATPNLKRLFGVRSDELVGQGLDALLDPDDSRALRALMAELRPGSGVSLRLRLRTGTGDWRWVQAGIEDRRNLPEIGGVLLQLRDVTPLMEFEAAMRETEDSLRRGEAFYRMIIEGTSDLVVLIDQQRRLLYVNPAVHATLGYTPAELMGKDVLSYVDPEDVGAAAEALAKALRQRWAAARLRVRHKDGGRRLFEAHARFTTDSDGRQIFVIAARDITHENALEQHAIQEGRLEAVGRLAGGVAHDFNNLLTVIQGNAELALAQPDKPEAGRLREIMDAAVRAGELVQQLLTFGRKQPVQVRAVDLNALLQEHAGFIRRVLGSGIRFHLSLPEQALGVRADPLALTRALLNMAANARDAMPQGGVFSLACGTYQVGAEEADAHSDREMGDYVRLDLRDTGEGMSSEVLARIFEPYFSTRNNGNGLGLAMVLGTVRQVGGFMQVSSESGQGSQFSIFLPQADLGAAADVSAETPSPLVSERHLGACVLVVDDEAGVRNLAADALRQAGYQVLEAADGEEALALWREARHHHQRIDLVLSDVVMPRMSGFQLMEQIQITAPAQAYLLMSGFHDARQGHTEAYKVSLYKPFSVQQLIQSVHNRLAVGHS